MRSIHKHYSEAKYAKVESRWAGYGSKHSRAASKAYNKAARKASKLRLLNFR